MRTLLCTIDEKSKRVPIIRTGMQCIFPRTCHKRTRSVSGCACIIAIPYKCCHYLEMIAKNMICVAVAVAPLNTPSRRSCLEECNAIVHYVLKQLRVYKKVVHFYQKCGSGLKQHAKRTEQFLRFYGWSSLSDTEGFMKCAHDEKTRRYRHIRDNINADEDIRLFCCCANRLDLKHTQREIFQLTCIRQSGILSEGKPRVQRFWVALNWKHVEYLRSAVEIWPGIASIIEKRAESATAHNLHPYLPESSCGEHIAQIWYLHNLNNIIPIVASATPTHLASAPFESTYTADIQHR